MAGQPFIVEVDYGSAEPATFTLTEDELRTDPDLQIRAAAIAKDEDPRRALRTAAYTRVLRILTRNLDQPTSVVDGDSITVIPTHAIRAIRLRDPEVSGDRRPFGFVLDREQV